MQNVALFQLWDCEGRCRIETFPG